MKKTISIKEPKILKALPSIEQRFAIDIDRSLESKKFQV